MAPPRPCSSAYLFVTDARGAGGGGTSPAWRSRSWWPAPPCPWADAPPRLCGPHIRLCGGQGRWAGHPGTVKQPERPVIYQKGRFWRKAETTPRTWWWGSTNALALRLCGGRPQRHEGDPAHQPPRPQPNFLRLLAGAEAGADRPGVKTPAPALALFPRASTANPRRRRDRPPDRRLRPALGLAAVQSPGDGALSSSTPSDRPYRVSDDPGPRGLDGGDAGKPPGPRSKPKGRGVGDGRGEVAGGPQMWVVTRPSSAITRDVARRFVHQDSRGPSGFCMSTGERLSVTWIEGVAGRGWPPPGRPGGRGTRGAPWPQSRTADLPTPRGSPRTGSAIQGASGLGVHPLHARHDRRVMPG